MRHWRRLVGWWRRRPVTRWECEACFYLGMYDCHEAMCSRRTWEHWKAIFPACPKAQVEHGHGPRAERARKRFGM